MTHDEAQTVRRSRSVGRRTVTIGQIVAGLLGLFLVIVGGVAMARLGFERLTGDTTEVLGIGHTLALGIIDVIVGLIFLSAATTSFGVRSTLIGLGSLALAFGAVVTIEPSPFDDFLGDGRPLGVLYLLVGIVALIAGLTTPSYVTEEAAFREERVDEQHIVP